VAFWEDRYHATAVEKEGHLFRCLVYIDLNMVRAGVVEHPSQWSSCGYNEIQEPKRKKVLIDYEKLRTLLGFESYDLAQSYHKKLVNEYLRGANNIRDDKWTKGIAVGSEDFVKRIKATLGMLAKGRKSRETPEAYQLRESPLLGTLTLNNQQDSLADPLHPSSLHMPKTRRAQKSQRRPIGLSIRLPPVSPDIRISSPGQSPFP